MGKRRQRIRNGEARALHSRVTERASKFLRELVQGDVAAATYDYYRGRAAMVAPGHPDAEAFVEFMTKHHYEALDGNEPRRCAATMQQIKSACMFVAYVDGASWDGGESDEVDAALSGWAAHDPEKLPRGQMDLTMVQQVLDYCHARKWHDTEHGLLVILGACCRAQDIEIANNKSCDERPGDVLLFFGKNKSAGHGRVQGSRLPRPVVLPAACKVLRDRIKFAHELAEKNDVAVEAVRLFPKFSRKQSAEAVQACAVRYDWPTYLTWTGTHNFRHSAAAEVFDEVLSKVMAQGRWESAASAALYGAPRAKPDGHADPQPKTSVGITLSVVESAKEMVADQTIRVKGAKKKDSPTQRDTAATAGTTKGVPKRGSKAKSASKGSTVGKKPAGPNTGDRSRGAKQVTTPGGKTAEK